MTSRWGRGFYKSTKRRLGLISHSFRAKYREKKKKKERKLQAPHKQILIAVSVCLSNCCILRETCQRVTWKSSGGCDRYIHTWAYYYTAVTGKRKRKKCPANKNANTVHDCCPTLLCFALGLLTRIEAEGDLPSNGPSR